MKDKWKSDEKILKIKKGSESDTVSVWVRATFSCIEKKTHLKANGIIKKIAVITHPYEKKKKRRKKSNKILWVET